MDSLVRRYRTFRLLLAAIVIVGVPTTLSIPAFLDEAPIEVGEPSPRTVVAPTLIRVEDPEQTEIARQQARESVRPIVEFNPDAVNEVVQAVRTVFATVQSVRQPAQPTGPGAPASPSPQEQVDALESQIEAISEEGLRLLVGLSDPALERLTRETIDIVQQLARQRIREEDLESVVNEQLRIELAVRDLSERTQELVVAPLIRSVMRPTVVVDEEATREAREEAAAEVAEVVQTFPKGSVIVSAGEEVAPVELEALQRAGLAGSNPRWEWLRALTIVLAAAGVLASYLRSYRTRIWRSNRKLLLLATLIFGWTIMMVALSVAIDRNPIHLYSVPSASLAMLTTILLGAPIGVLVTIPATLLVAFVAPDQPGVIAFTAAAMLLSVPLVTQLSSRADLRRGTLLATGGVVILAGVFAGVFTGLDEVPRAVLAGLIHGVATAIIVIGGLPFIESAFGVVTATGLIDLADRNHPLLRELEQKALGSYNHSIMVATLVERACRAIGADALLGSVAALYHDIGKVRRPYFFVENQFGVPNPHSDLEPEVSAFIIQEHVSDGVEMARSFRLPPEVVDGIATHHGTTLVSYFYLEAIRRAEPGQLVEEETYRYKGRKPSTKETAVLMLADCCEAASRAAAQNDRNLSNQQLEDIVEGLFADRIDDGQLDDSPLTFQDLASVRASFIETLVGVYHPRIAYPSREESRERRRKAERATA